MHKKPWPCWYFSFWPHMFFFYIFFFLMFDIWSTVGHTHGAQGYTDTRMQDKTHALLQGRVTTWCCNCATEAIYGTTFSAVPSSPIHGQYFPHSCLILPHSWSSVLSWGSEALTFLRIPEFQRPLGLFLLLRFSMLIAPSFLSHAVVNMYDMHRSLQTFRKVSPSQPCI